MLNGNQRGRCGSSKTTDATLDLFVKSIPKDDVKYAASGRTPIDKALKYERI
jgi:hypothetical protein